MAKDPRLNKNREMPLLMNIPPVSLSMSNLKKGRLFIIEEMLDTINKDLDNIEEKIVEKLDNIEEKIVEKLDNIEETINEKLDKIEEKILFLVNALL